LTYDDIVAEAAMCEVCNEDPCACDEEVKEHNHLADFEQYLEDLTTFDYDVVESDSAKTKMIFSGNYYFMGKHAENVFVRNDLELVNVSQDDDSNTVEYTVVGSPEDLSFAQSEFESMDDAEGSYGGAYSESDEPDSEDDVPFDGPYTKNQGDVTDKSGAVHTGHSRAKHLAKQAIPTEVVEFIQSMYDSNTGTFPRGEEGVKIACEKKFGESAAKFAQYAVERLSANAVPFVDEDFSAPPQDTTGHGDYIRKATGGDQNVYRLSQLLKDPSLDSYLKISVDDVSQPSNELLQGIKSKKWEGHGGGASIGDRGGWSLTAKNPMYFTEFLKALSQSASGDTQIRVAIDPYVKNARAKNQETAEDAGDPQVTPGMKTQYGTVVSVEGNTVTVKTSNGDMTTVDIHDIDQATTEGNNMPTFEQDAELVRIRELIKY
jgi:hypothetical protein